jgi:hypothetical protein
MIPYLIVYLIVLLLTYFSEKLLKKKCKSQSIFIILISIFLLSFFAAVRDDCVGKDITTYVIPVFKWAQYLNLEKFMNTGNLENGYMLYVYVVSKIFNDYHFILFFMQFMVSAVVYRYAYKNNEKFSMTLTIFTYLMLFYPDSFTMMRQFVSMSFILISLEYFENKKYIKTIITFLLAMLFHKTAIFASIAYLIIAMNNKKIFTSLNKTKKILRGLVFIGFFIFLINYQNIIYFFTYNINILPSKYYEYFTSSYYNSSIVFSKLLLIYKCIWITIAYYMNNYLNDEKIKNAFYFLIFDFFIYLISFKLTPIMRLGYYFSFSALLIIIPRISEILKKDNENKILFNVLIFCFLFFFWYFTFIKNGENGGTYPYTSEILEKMF